MAALKATDQKGTPVKNGKPSKQTTAHKNMTAAKRTTSSRKATPAAKSLRVSGLVLMLGCAVALTACGPEPAKTEPAKISQRIACEKVYGDALSQMRGLMAGVEAGMTVGEFRIQYPRLAGTIQLAKDKAARDTACPQQIGDKVMDLHDRFIRDSQTARKVWNFRYEELQSEIAALP